MGILPLTPEVALVTTWSTELLQIADRWGSSRLVDDLHLNSPRTSIKPLMVTTERLIDQFGKIACLYVSVVFKNVANVAQACEVFHGFRRIAIPGSVPGGNREAWLLFGRGRVVWASLRSTFHCRDGDGDRGLWNRPIRGQLPATSLLAGYSGDGVGRSWDGMKAYESDVRAGVLCFGRRWKSHYLGRNMNIITYI